MTKRDLANRIARKSHYTQNEALEILQHMLDCMCDELAAGRTIEFRNFGVFDLAVRKPRIGRNPNSPSETVEIPERVVVRFKPGKEMTEKVSRLRSEDIESS